MPEHSSPADKSLFYRRIAALVKQDNRRPALAGA